MKINELFHAQDIIAELQGTTKKQVLEELSRHVAACKPQIDPEELLKVLVERERLGSTGIGNGIAIPHGKLRELDDIALVFGKSTQGIDFEAIDGKPVNLIFLLVAPSNSAGVHLKALARLSRLLKDKGFQQSLMEASDAQSLYAVIAESDNKIEA